MERGTGQERSASTASPERRALPAVLFGCAGVLLLVPVGLAVTDARHLSGYGWPGPYRSSVAELQVGEALWEIQLVAVFAVLVLAGATLGAAFAARAAGQRVWAVCALGVSLTVAAVLLAALLLTL
jgi:hypothetical protein